MRSAKVFFLFLLVAVASCNKVTPVPLTSDQQLEYDINLIDQYLAEHNIEAIKLESGVRVVITQQGDGPAPTKDDCMRILYTGYGLNETTAFDTNAGSGTGWITPFKNVVMGMQIGLKQAGVGSKVTIYIPSALGYSTKGSGYDPTTGLWDIDPNECIVFDVELLQLYPYNALANYCIQ